MKGVARIQNEARSTPSHQEGVYFLTREKHYKLPLTASLVADHGNYVISINKFVKWLAGKGKKRGSRSYGFAGRNFSLTAIASSVYAPTTRRDKQPSRIEFRAGYD